jgi:NADH dehydrogenase
VLLLDAGPRVLAAYPEDLSAKAEKTLARLGVEVHTECYVTDAGPGWVETGGPKSIGRVDATVMVWAAGVQASPLGKLLGAPLDKRGAVVVDGQLNPPGLPEVFVLGDLAHFIQDGHQVPGVAQPAMHHVGRMIAADLAGKDRPGFRYFDKGDMATIGRLAAIAKVEWPFKAHLSGFLAWMTWAVVHIFFLIGFRNRLRVAASWFWTYLTFNRGARLITGNLHLPGWEEQANAVRGEGAHEEEKQPLASSS